MSAARVMVVWCPDWPVLAALEDAGLARDLPAAVFTGHRVVAATAAARGTGVRRGMRRRDAQSRCPELEVLEHQPAAESRAFEVVLRALEEVGAQVAPIRPGLCAVRAAGRYYGDEPSAAATAAERLVDLGVWDCRFGVADGPFVAEQAARQAAVQDCVVVEPGEAAAFLGPLDIGVLDVPDLVSLLRRLGLHTLKDFAALSPASVQTRFGAQGQALHRIVRGHREVGLARRSPPPDWQREVCFEPPLDSAETVAFSVRRAAEDLVATVAAAGSVCTAVRIDLGADGVLVHQRDWWHPRWFAAADLVDRVRWQAQGAQVAEPLDRVVLTPQTVEPVAEHAEGLWGGAPADRIVRGVARVQSLAGPEAVGVPLLQGGRSPADRQVLIPWGEPAEASVPRDRPWPGAIPSPAPAVVYAEPRPAWVVGERGHVVAVSGSGALSSVPARFRPLPSEPEQPIEAWAGPWPVDERWWDPLAARRLARFQVVGADGRAWLMAVENGVWKTEAAYD